jgi:predicted homoserine dehydrogenase-like protein
LRDVPKDDVLTYDDVALPAGRLADKLRADQYKMFRGESWLAEHQARSVSALGSMVGA